MIDSFPWVKPLLVWFKKNARVMPWRENQSPYRTYVSEMMLQQTQIDTVIPYFNRFMQAFPTVEELAKADRQTVLKLWEGLGYYTRANNLHLCAQKIVEFYAGKFPKTDEELIKLPGIGPYSASAIASIAYDLPTPVVDGNVLRVYARLIELNLDIKNPATRNVVFNALKQPIINSKNPSFFNQALMELGALICKPKTPLCITCPIMNFCMAYQHHTLDKYPLTSKKKQSPHKKSVLFLIEKEGRFLLKQRTEKLWHHLWVFPQFLSDECIDLNLTNKIDLNHELTHVFTHFTLEIKIFKASLKNILPENYRWFTQEEILSLPMPTPHRKIANLYTKK